MMNDYDKERLTLLLNDNAISLQFAKPQSVQQMDALDYFKTLSPEKCTELLGEIYTHYAVWYNDQQKELAKVGGW